LASTCHMHEAGSQTHAPCLHCAVLALAHANLSKHAQHFSAESCCNLEILILRSKGREVRDEAHLGLGGHKPRVRGSRAPVKPRPAAYAAHIHVRTHSGGRGAGRGWELTGWRRQHVNRCSCGIWRRRLPCAFRSTVATSTPGMHVSSSSYDIGELPGCAELQGEAGDVGGEVPYQRRRRGEQENVCDGLVEMTRLRLRLVERKRGREGERERGYASLSRTCTFRKVRTEVPYEAV
jgi:hypothetical protein